MANESRAIRPAALRPQDAATYLGVSARTVYNLMSRGELRFVKVGGCTVIPVAELDQYLADGLGAKPLLHRGPGYRPVPTGGGRSA